MRLLITLLVCVLLNWIAQRDSDYWVKVAATLASFLVAGEAVGEAVERAQRRRKRSEERDL